MKNTLTKPSKEKSLDPKVFFKNDRFLLINDSVFGTDQVESGSVDLIVTSPPYNVDIKYNSHDDQLTYDDYLEFSRKWMSRCYEWLKNDGRFCLNIPLDKNKGGQQSVGADLTRIAKKEVGFKYHSTIVWNEGNISRRTAWGSWMSASAPYVIAPVELIVVLYKNEWKKTSGSKVSDISKKDFMDWTNGLWTFSGESKTRIGHPAPFPIELPRRCIRLFSYKDDTILDPFLGSGSTLVAANLCGRKGIGIDVDTQYCKIALDRLKKEGQLGQFNLDDYVKAKEKPLKKESNRISQPDVILQYFIDNPSRDIAYAEIQDWIENDYKLNTGLSIKYFDRRVRVLTEKGSLIRVKNGVFRYNPKFYNK